MSARPWSRLAVRIGACLLVASAGAVLAGPGAVGPAVAQAQETADGTTATASGDGSQIQTAANADGEGDGDGGILGTVLSILGGIAGAILGFLDSWIGHALVGIPLGIYLGLKAIALYLEHYE